MKNECMNYNYVYGSDYPTERLVNKLSEKSSIKTMRPDKRPYGVGLLIAGFDVNMNLIKKSGPRLFRTCPSGNFYEYTCTAIGARCQTANTYLENRIDEFKNLSVDELIRHSIEAMKKAQDFT